MTLAKARTSGILGGTSAADDAFVKMAAEITRLERHPAWSLIIGKVQELERDLDVVGGFDREVHEVIRETGQFFGPKEILDRYFAAIDIISDIDDLASALVATMQTRLNAVEAARRKVYGDARNVDGIDGIPHEAALPDLNHIWQLGNYVKHNDEWGTKLDRRQQRCLEALEEVGLQPKDERNGFVNSWPALEAVCLIGNDPIPSNSLRKLCERSVVLCKDATHAIQVQFRPFAAEIEKIRKRNFTDRFVRASTERDV